MWSPPSLVTLAVLAGCLPSVAQADIVWVGGVSSDIFDEANWDLSQSVVTVIDPNVSIDDDVVIRNAPLPVEIPSQPNQMRFQLASGRRLTLDGSRLVALDNDGVGGAPGGSIDIDVIAGASFEPYFVVNGARVDIDATSMVVFGGPGNPMNASTVNITGGALLRFLAESPSEFITEHLSKVMVDGAPAVLGQNITVVGDGLGGCSVTVSAPGPLDSDDDLLTDDEETNVHGTNPNDADTDGDGTPDGLEIARGLDPLDAMSRLDRPNVVFILCDDLGWGDLGVNFQNSVIGTKRLHTPNLDLLAAEGLVMTRHYCPAAVCAPSRASLLAGVHQGHANVRNNQFDKALERNHTVGTTLGRAGYATALIGKYGLQGGGSSPATWPAYPTRRGFETFYGYVRHGDGHTHYPAHVTAARPQKQVWDQETEVSADLDLCYTTDLFTARAKKFIVDHRAQTPEQPFFLLLAYDTPHAALHTPTQAYPAGAGLGGGLQWTGVPGAMINTASGTIDSWLHPDYASQPWNEGDRRFATMVRRLDDAVGDLLQTLRDLGIAEDTLVVFTSDNGPHEESYTPGISYDANAFDSFGPLDGIKRDAWEGGVRVPALAWWPGTIQPGRVDDTPSQFHDWLATWTELGGWTTPARTDGVSLLPTLTGVGTQREGTVYVEYQTNSSTPNYPEFDPSHRGRARGQEQVIYLDGYKGVRVAVQSHADPFEIYDVSADPQETINLAGSSAYFIGLGDRMRDRVLRLRRIEPSAARPYDSALVQPLAVTATRIGLDYDAFEGFWPWLPEFDLLTPVASGTAAQVDVAAHLTAPSGAGLFYSGLIDVPTDGLWTFEIECAGAALLRIHDIQAVDDDFNHSGAPITGSVRLAAGLHPIRLWYRTANLAPALALRWSGPGVALAPIPAGALVREDDSLGTRYCDANTNSSGFSAAIFAEGSPIVFDDDILLTAEQLPTSSFGFFLTSRAQGFAANPGGSDGNLCLGGSIGRYVGPGEVGNAGAAGRIELRLDLSRMPTPTGFIAAMNGESWHFQAWFRDANPGPTSNFTDGVTVTFL